jgi:hypothetical protein
LGELLIVPADAPEWDETALFADTLTTFSGENSSSGFVADGAESGENER